MTPSVERSRRRNHFTLKFRRSILAKLLFLLALTGVLQNYALCDKYDCSGRRIPQLVDITAKTGIKFVHTSAPEKKYIVESMSGGVLLLDYDRDGWLDIYFTNAPTVEMALKHEKARGALYHNNHDGTFTDMSDKAAVATPCFANGGAVGDYNNDGWP